MEIDSFVSVPEAMAILGVSRASVFNYARRGLLPAYRAKVGRKGMVFRRADVEKLIQPRRVRAQCAP